MEAKILEDHLYINLKSNIGSNESTEMILVVDLKEGKARIKVTKELTSYYDYKDQEEAERLYNTLIASGWIISNEVLRELKQVGKIDLEMFYKRPKSSIYKTKKK
jgi:phosphoserine aminotransferase